MEPREICVLKKLKGRNRCIVLSSVVMMTLHELWARMIAWVCKLGEPTAFIFSGSDLHWKQNHPSKQKEFFFFFSWKIGGQVAAACRGQTTQRQIAPSCVLENFLWKSLSPQQNFVAATCPRTTKKSNQTEFVRLVAATKSCCRKKDFFHKNSPVHTKRFVAAMCRRNVLLQLVARLVHTEWSVAETCCCNLPPSVFRSLIF